MSFYGSLNLTEILAALKSKTASVQKIQTQKGEQIVFDINVWVHEEADQFNNNASVQISLNKEAYANKVPNKLYIGNLKYRTPNAEDATAEDIEKLANDVNEDDIL